MTRIIKTTTWTTIGGALLLLSAASLTIISVPTYADTAGTTVSSNVGSTISVFTTNGTVNVNTTPTASGVQTIASDTVTVSTNNSNGYTLKLGLTNATATLTSGANTIPQASGTFASPAAMTANTWGYRVDGIGTFGAGPTSSASNQAIGSTTFAKVAASGSPDTIKTTNTTATNNTTTVWYGVATNTNTPSGTYTDGVTYTATTN